MSYDQDSVEQVAAFVNDAAHGDTYDERLRAIHAAIESLVGETDLHGFMYSIPHALGEGPGALPQLNLLEGRVWATWEDYPQRLADYAGRWAPSDPVVQSCPRLPNRAFRFTFDWSSGRGIDAEHHRRCGTGHLLVSAVQLFSEQGLAFGLQRRLDGSPFTLRDQRALELIYPAVGSAIRGALLLEELRAAPEPKVVEDSSLRGGALFTREGELVRADTGARALLRDVDAPPEVIADCITAEISYQALLGTLNRSHESVLHFPLRGGGYVRALIAWVPQRPFIGLLLRRCTPGSTDHFSAAAIRYRLTRREVEATRLAAQGWSNRQIAAELGIAITTVAQHLRNVYSKTGSGGRAELPALFLGPSPE